jgi:hypothetical protein
MNKIIVIIAMGIWILGWAIIRHDTMTIKDQTALIRKQTEIMTRQSTIIQDKDADLKKQQERIKGLLRLIDKISGPVDKR